MGASGSLPFPRYGFCIWPQNPNQCKENHSQMPGSRKGHRRNLSAAFSFPEAESCVGSDQVNINTATEEELMTLPGINRQTAQNIVEYRRQINGFRKVEDLALVTGVGATRLNHIRLELSVGKRGLSKNSSASSSGIDLSMNDNVSRSSGQFRSPVKVNVNTSNVFQLMRVQFVSQHLAENIVAHRDKKGPFTSLDDLLKVKGCRPELLSAIQSYLMLEDEPAHLAAESANCESKFSIKSPLESQESKPLTRPFSSFRNSKISAAAKGSVRLAAWNMDNCCSEKMENPGVREVVAMTILENGFGIVALQEITNPQSMQKLVYELTSPVLENVKTWGGFRGDWKYIISSPFVVSTQANCHLAFLYDASKGIQLINSGFAYATSSSDDRISVPLYLAEFKVGDLDLTIANVHLDNQKDDSPSNESLVNALSSLLSHYEKQGNKHLLLVGHFGMAPDCPAMASLTAANFSPLLSSEDCSNPSSNPGSICTENMWISQELMKLKSGKADIICDGLTNPLIPKGMWGWGGAASSHCPFMTDFLVEENLEGSSGRATFILNSDEDI